MAGHSKWSQIKRTKAVVDSKRGALFTRLGRDIMVASRAGSDPAGNFQLRTAISKARAAAMPASNIDRAIAKGSGQAGEGAQLEDVRYEGYGPGGMAVMVEALTDNRNRTAADLRLAFSKNGGNLGENGCVSYLFEHRSEVSIKTDAGSEECLLESLLDLDTDGYDLIDTTTATVFGPFSALEALQDGLRKQGWNVEEWGHQWATTTNVSISDPDTARSCLKLLDALEGLDDVRSVSANLEIKTELEID